MYVAVETEIPIPVTMAMYAAMHSGHFGKNARIKPGIAHSTTVRPEHSHLEIASDISHLHFLPRHTRHDSSTNRTAGSAGSLRVNPPTPPAVRALSYRDSSTWCQAPRRRESR